MSRLLVVDDEEGVRRSLKKVLQPEGYTIVLAENGTEAIRLVSENGEDIETVISDFRMPGIDGLETLVAIGKLNPEITRILLTGYATMESAIEAVNAGIDGFITKPFENAELKSKIREYNLKKRLKQFVSEQILQMLHAEGVKISARRQQVSVLFCDIRGFTALVAETKPEELVEIMNGSYFTPLDNVIFACNGTLDKHIGDSIMAVFGAPMPSSDHADRALECALAMMAEMERVNGKLRVSGRELAIGIGIGSGEVMAGFFGSSRKREYTVLGPPVNRAARLEQQAQAGQMIICEDTFRRLSDKTRFGRLETFPLEVDGIAITVYSLSATSRGSM